MTSKLAQMQARFQQKQMQEKEEKLLRLYESQHQRTIEKLNRSSAGSNSSNTSITTGGKVRQMFDERRQKAGIDKSYPLEPLKTNKPNGLNKNTTKGNARTVIKTTVQKSIAHVKNGNVVANKNAVKHAVYNNNGGEEDYEEHIYSNGNGAGDFFDSQNAIVRMMNDHNLHDSLEDETFPDMGLDEVDQVNHPVNGKLTNLGGKLPSQNGIIKKATSLMVPKAEVSKTARSDPKPLLRKTVARLPSQPHPNRASNDKLSPQPSLTKSVSLQSQISKPSSRKMQPASSSNKKVTPARAPSETRPSAKQSSKSAIVRDDLEECRYCNRRFLPDRLQVHEDICSKTGKKKRKTYDAIKHRIQGTELEPYARKIKGTASLKSKTSTTSKKTADWRRTHEEFISAIRAAKMAQAHVAKGGKISDLPPPPPSSNPDYVQCPHCGRRFNQTAAERHIPKCATYQFNKPNRIGNASKTSTGGKNAR